MGVELDCVDSERIGIYEYHDRPRRNTAWSIAYGCSIIILIAFGVYGLANLSSDFGHALDPKFLGDANNCPYQGRKLVEVESDKVFGTPGSVKDAFLWVAVSAIAAWGLGIVYLLLFKHIPELVVHAAVAIQVLVPTVLGLLLFFAPSSPFPFSGFVLLWFAAVSALIWYIWRRKVALCARLLGVSAVGLNQNPGLILFSILLKLVEIAIILPMFFLIQAAYANGKIVPNRAREGRAACQNAQGGSVPCCTWQVDTWALFYIIFGAITLLWTILTVGQLRNFVISGTISQWYFAPAGLLSSTKGMTMRSVKHGLGPSFGTLTFGGAILSIVEAAKGAGGRGPGRSSCGTILGAIVYCFLQCFLKLVEHLTRFAVVMASITGEDFVSAGRKATDLLQRNLLEAFSNWWMPSFVMRTCSLVFSIAWGLTVYLSYWAFNSARNSSQDEGLIVGIICTYITYVVLSFFGTILLNIVDAAYLCFALDRDSQTITKQEVHDVFRQMPLGAAVEQPGGEVQFANPNGYTALSTGPETNDNHHAHHDNTARV